MSFHNRLNYSLGNETWLSESKALGMVPGDKVLCITASGDRPLHLLLNDPQQVVSVDFNPIQNYLLELKIAAIKELSYAQFMAFMGVHPCADRLSTYPQLRDQLSDNAREYWDTHPKMLRKGVVFQGKVEQFCLFFSLFFQLLYKKKTKILLGFDCVEQQAKYVEENWDTKWHRLIYKLSIAAPKIPRISVFDDPGLHAYVDDSIDPGFYMYARKIDYLKRGLANKSLLLQLLYHGELVEKGYPACLREENYLLIRSRVDRIIIDTEDITRFLNKTDQTFDVFSLSDTASYMPHDQFHTTLEGVKCCAKPGARFCFREYMTRYSIPQHLEPVFVRDKNKEQEAEFSESNFVYNFMAGRVVV